ncbi:MAG: hypothetical protein SA339_08205 [Methanomassiliicoccus sp.]|nr:hypothetical protein [Methanomassiliicoccus sp.]
MKRIHLVIAIVGIVAAIIISGAAVAGVFDPPPKNVILKAQDMELIPGLHGDWTQTTLDLRNITYSLDGAKNTALSCMELENATGHSSCTIIVAEMHSAEQAKEQYLEAISPNSFQNSSFWNQTSLDSIGDGGVMFTSNSPTPLTGCWVFFHKGVYMVKMLGVGDVNECQSIMLRLAEAQADRL